MNKYSPAQVVLGTYDILFKSVKSRVASPLLHFVLARIIYLACTLPSSQPEMVENGLMNALRY